MTLNGVMKKTDRPPTRAISAASEYSDRNSHMIFATVIRRIQSSTTVVDLSHPSQSSRMLF